MRKTIFHIDLDAFFCSCEEIVNPKLKGKAFVVSGRNKRSVVSCASYPARKLGIKAAKPIYMELDKVPSLIVVPGHYELYDKMSMQFFQYIKKHFSNICEEMSIDECFLDVTNALKHYKNDPVLLAKTLQANVKRTLGLSVSIGISHNKFLAKMATDLNKPYGITTILSPEELKTKIWPLPIEEMFFVGPPTAKRLRNIGIKTIGDLANFDDVKLLEATLDRNWYTTWQNALGNGDDFVDTRKNDPKSQSVSHTLLDPTNDVAEIETTLKYIAQELQTKLEAYNMAGSCVGVIYKINKVNRIKNETLNHNIYKWQDLANYALKLLGMVWDGNSMIQLLGINISKLIKVDSMESLEQKLVVKKQNKLNKIVQEVNKKLGKDLVFIAKDKFIS
ncbi:MAG: DNA polymerase IV [Mycoplasma sp.]|nr:DNA polymerase IV [Candidatus Hennigella equi]